MKKRAALVALFYNILNQRKTNMSKQIFSTLTTDQKYSIYKPSKNKGQPAVLESKGGKPMQIAIKGGHGVAGEHLQTPHGVCTEVSDQVHAALETCDMFKRHEKRGFIKVYDKKAAPEKVAQDMAEKDGGAPLTSADFVKPPVAGNAEQPAA